jgi:hypothetical protein
VAVEVRRQRQDRRRALRPHARRVRLPALRRRCRGRTATSRARRLRRRPSRRRRPATPSWARAIECDAHEYRGQMAALEPHARAAAIDDVGEERNVGPVDNGRGSCTAQAKRAPGPHRRGQSPLVHRERLVGHHRHASFARETSVETAHPRPGAVRRESGRRFAQVVMTARNRYCGTGAGDASGVGSDEARLVRVDNRLDSVA